MKGVCGQDAAKGSGREEDKFDVLYNSAQDLGNVLKDSLK